MSYPAISLATATAGRHRRPQKRLQTAANLPSTRIRARIIAPVTPSPPSAVLTPSIPVHRWIRAKRGDTGGAGQPLQPENAVALQQRIERGDTAGAGQSLQPARAGPQLQRVERVCAKQPGIPGAARWRRPAPLLKPRALSRGRTAYRPEGAPIACWLSRTALPRNGYQPLPSSASRSTAV